MNVELRHEAVSDLNDGAMFYESQREGLGSYFLKSITQDLSNLTFEGGIHQRNLGAHHSPQSSRMPSTIESMAKS